MHHIGTILVTVQISLNVTDADLTGWEEFFMAGNLIIAINRQYGSGGKEIGTKIAQALNIPIYDQEIPELASKKSGIRKDYFEKVDEKPTDSFLYALAMNTFSMNGTMNPFDNTLSSDRLFNLQAEVVKDIAKEGPCVIIGRCAEYILRDEANCLSIYICSPLEKRIERITRLYNLTPKEAQKRITSTDKKRESYYGYYAGKDWASCASYDLSVDAGVLGVDKAVELIKKYIELRRN